MRQLPDIVKAAAVLGVAIVLAGLLMGGFYQLVPVGSDGLRAYRINRFTGSTVLIFGSYSSPVHAVGQASATATPAP